MTKRSKRHLFAPLVLEFAPDVRQHLWLDQHALSLVAATAPAEADNNRISRAFRLDPACQQCIARGQELEIVQTDAAQARRSRLLHDEEIAGAAASVTGPLGIQWLDHHKVRCTAGLLRQPFALPLREFRRDPMGSVRLFDRGCPAPAEP